MLVDEGHDFEPEWLKLVAQMVHPETNSLLVLYDDAQSINRRKARLGFSFADVGIQARGRTTILRMNYRNTAQIMAVACEFARDLLSAKVLYVAMTRAMERLHMTRHAKSVFVDRLRAAVGAGGAARSGAAA